jgi:protein TonB
VGGGATDRSRLAAPITAQPRRLPGLLPSVAAHLLLIAVAITKGGTHPPRPPDLAPEVTLMIDPLPRATPPPAVAPVPEPPPAIAAAMPPTPVPPVRFRARPAPIKPRREAPSAPAPATDEAHPSAPAPPVEAAQPTPGWDGLMAAWLAAHRHYPDAARRDNAEGDVTVRFTVAPDGHVLSVAIVHGSGSDRLDEAARALLDAANLPAPRVPRSVTVRIRYRLDHAD